MQDLSAAGGGTWYGFFCEYKITGGSRDFLKVGVDATRFAGASQKEVDEVLSWLPKAGFQALIDVLCRRRHPPDDPILFLPLNYPLSDPQKADMRFFRKRCRYDVLRVIDDGLNRPEPVSEVALTEIAQSQLLTRLYDEDDLQSALKYWLRQKIVTGATFNDLYLIDETADEEVARLIDEYDWEETRVGSSVERGQDDQKRVDVFICHASEDKDDFVRSLADALREHGLEVWYDDFVLSLGDRLRQKIDEGLRAARYGVVVLSEAFFSKNWTQYELDGLAQREMSGGQKVVLPIWHKVSRDDVEKYSPALAGRLAISSDRPLDELVPEILKVVKGGASGSA